MINTKHTKPFAKSQILPPYFRQSTIEISFSLKQSLLVLSHNQKNRDRFPDQSKQFHLNFSSIVDRRNRPTKQISLGVQILHRVFLPLQGCSVDVRPWTNL